MADILLVDDDANLCLVLSQMLEHMGHTVRCARNGIEAMRIYEKDSSMDLIITDIFMPEKEGLETIREVHRLNPRQKIIAMSGGGGGSGPDTFLHIAQRTGAAGILLKPFSYTDLSNAIDQVLSKPDAAPSSGNSGDAIQPRA